MPKVENFGQWSEGAKWAMCHLLTFVPDDVWERAPDGRPRITIEIEGSHVENLQKFFEDVMSAFRKEVDCAAAELVLDSFNDERYKITKLFSAMADQIEEQICKTFDVYYDSEYGEFRKRR